MAHMDACLTNSVGLCRTKRQSITKALPELPTVQRGHMQSTIIARRKKGLVG